MNLGKIIEYIDLSRFVCTLCIQDKGNRLHLLTPSNREVNLSVKRAVFISGSAIDTARPREELLENLNQIETARIALKGQINVRELWELIRDEKEAFDHKYLAQLVFGQSVTDDHLSALVRALFDDGLYFKMREGAFLPNSEEKAEKLIKQREDQALKEERLNHGSIWLRDIQQGKMPKETPFKEHFIDLLTQLALYENNAKDFKYGKELLLRAGISNIQEAKGLLVRLGVWEEDENLDLLRSNIDTAFTKQQLDEATCLAELKIDFHGREDLRNLPILTIDGPSTRDYDDSISIEIANDSILLGIHIADVAAIVSPGGILDREAAGRASSVYLPRRQIPMFPISLSEETLSLKQGCDRQAISLLARFDRAGELLDFRFVLSVIRVQQQLTYEEVDKALTEKDPSAIPCEVKRWQGMLQEMQRISRVLHQKRMDQGALTLSLPDLNVKCNADSSIVLGFMDQDTPSRNIVAEFMILYNWLAARFCRDNQIPVLFRTQAEPAEILPMDEKGYLYYVFRQRRKLRPLHINTKPHPHSGLGLDVYIQATSPIRRYLDLLIQRQIGSYLMGIAPYFDEKKLEEIMTPIAPSLREIGIIQRNRLRYWTLKFLIRQRGERYKAIVLDELKSNYRILLTDFLLVTEVKRKAGVIHQSGDDILVEIKKVDPWNDLLHLEYVDR